MPYLLESSELDCACHPYCSARFESGGFVATISISLVVQFLGICLVVITFGNSISSSILRDGVWMPTGWKHNYS
jgi:hypothetical protein